MSLQVLGPLQWVFLLNPLVFMSEAMRLAVTPEIPHMPLALILAGLLLFTLVLALAGARSFEKRTIL
jgi:ABC-2 type transport system permease protein